MSVNPVSSKLIHHVALSSIFSAPKAGDWSRSTIGLMVMAGLILQPPAPVVCAKDSLMLDKRRLRAPWKERCIVVWASSPTPSCSATGHPGIWLDAEYRSVRIDSHPNVLNDVGRVFQGGQRHLGPRAFFWPARMLLHAYRTALGPSNCSTWSRLALSHSSLRSPGLLARRPARRPLRVYASKLAGCTRRIAENLTNPGLLGPRCDGPS